MYNIPYFKANDPGEVLSFMRQHPFVILCGADASGKPVATHVPVLLEERDGRLILRAHTMRKQAHTEAFTENQQVLVIFTGPHAYVSASWYENPQLASTWNYLAVHASGRLRFVDEAALYQLLVDLTEKFEGNPHSPAQVKDMDPDYVARMLPAIVGFEIEVLDLQHVFKLSQNRSPADHEQIVQRLESGDPEARAIAEYMHRPT